MGIHQFRVRGTIQPRDCGSGRGTWVWGRERGKLYWPLQENSCPPGDEFLAPALNMGMRIADHQNPVIFVPWPSSNSLRNGIQIR